MSYYPDGMTRNRILDSRDVALPFACPKCGVESQQQLEEFDTQVWGIGFCPECEYEWDIDTHFDLRELYDYNY